MPLKHLLGLASWITNPVTGLARAMVNPPEARRLWSSGDRTHLEVRGLHQVGNAAAAREVEQRLCAREGVFAAEFNAVLGRVAVDHDTARVSPAELMQVIGEVETAHGLETAPTAPEARCTRRIPRRWCVSWPRWPPTWRAWVTGRLGWYCRWLVSHR